ncbi:exodeoxyribonuclease VII large subunit [candidate division WWE3 bacterium CG10_big_fil_rev_8_21_14_0_10_32_10]|uniref:Exodeoxyribonuclease 7 large subunit n=1 Tax=candidate division WWE3 bacterium CG10_big_fil_rev_8_21_14_0_10_32_10 TaxID=1975090 RepID=A0A2H0RBN6_UNCKA|nr:MAG: exodeoxyribonuclease VII large subunit [candidate division WWE3 bacterium CG10_big_fil_rev_8_21_14_0_10_32_10]
MNFNSDIEQIFSVSEYLDLVNAVIEPVKFTIQGEVGQLTERGSAIYFSLLDKTDNSKLDSLMWRYKYDYMGFEIKEGMEIKVYGNANIYKPLGKFTFIADQISSVGEGELKANLEALKNKLQQDGYFDTEHKKQIPVYIKTIGLITSNFGDAKKDFITHLGNFGFKVIFYDVRVEGMQSISNIVEAIKWFNETTQEIDVLVITRGGGSLESLQSFNSFEVAKAIYSSRIPIICGVGHENDITIADLVADVRASTPTHAGRIISDPWKNAKQLVESVGDSIKSSFKNKVLIYKQKLKSIEENLYRNFYDNIKENNKAIYDIDRDINLSINNWIKNIDKKIDALNTNLNLADPALKLKQGYSITRSAKNNIVKDIKDVKIGESVTIQLSKGVLTSRIEKNT